MDSVLCMDVGFRSLPLLSGGGHGPARLGETRGSRGRRPAYSSCTFSSRGFPPLLCTLQRLGRAGCCLCHVPGQSCPGQMGHGVKRGVCGMGWAGGAGPGGGTREQGCVDGVPGCVDGAPWVRGRCPRVRGRCPPGACTVSPGCVDGAPGCVDGAPERTVPRPQRKVMPWPESSPGVAGSQLAVERTGAVARMWRRRLSWLLAGSPGGFGGSQARRMWPGSRLARGGRRPATRPRLAP